MVFGLGKKSTEDGVDSTFQAMDDLNASGVFDLTPRLAPPLPPTAKRPKGRKSSIQGKDGGGSNINNHRIAMEQPPPPNENEHRRPSRNSSLILADLGLDHYLDDDNEKSSSSPMSSPTKNRSRLAFFKGNNSGTKNMDSATVATTSKSNKSSSSFDKHTLQEVDNASGHDKTMAVEEVQQQKASKKKNWFFRSSANGGSKSSDLNDSQDINTTTDHADKADPSGHDLNEHSIYDDDDEDDDDEGDDTNLVRSLQQKQTNSSRRYLEQQNRQNRIASPTRNSRPKVLNVDQGVILVPATPLDPKEPAGLCSQFDATNLPYCPPIGAASNESSKRSSNKLKSTNQTATPKTPRRKQRSDSPTKRSPNNADDDNHKTNNMEQTVEDDRKTMKPTATPRSSTRKNSASGILPSIAIEENYDAATNDTNEEARSPSKSPSRKSTRSSSSHSSSVKMMHLDQQNHNSPQTTSELKDEKNIKRRSSGKGSIKVSSEGEASPNTSFVSTDQNERLSTRPPTKRINSSGSGKSSGSSRKSSSDGTANDVSASPTRRTRKIDKSSVTLRITKDPLGDCKFSDEEGNGDAEVEVFSAPKSASKKNSPKEEDDEWSPELEMRRRGIKSKSSNSSTPKTPRASRESRSVAYIESSSSARKSPSSTTALISVSPTKLPRKSSSSSGAASVAVGGSSTPSKSRPSLALLEDVTSSGSSSRKSSSRASQTVADPKERRSRESKSVMLFPASNKEITIPSKTVDSSISSSGAATVYSSPRKSAKQRLQPSMAIVEEGEYSPKEHDSTASLRAGIDVGVTDFSLSEPHPFSSPAKSILKHSSYSAAQCGANVDPQRQHSPITQQQHRTSTETRASAVDKEALLESIRSMSHQPSESNSGSSSHRNFFGKSKAGDKKGSSHSSSKEKGTSTKERGVTRSNSTNSEKSVEKVLKLLEDLGQQQQQSNNNNLHSTTSPFSSPVKRRSNSRNDSNALLQQMESHNNKSDRNPSPSPTKSRSRKNPLDKIKDEIKQEADKERRSRSLSPGKERSRSKSKSGSSSRRSRMDDV